MTEHEMDEFARMISTMPAKALEIVLVLEAARKGKERSPEKMRAIEARLKELREMAERHQRAERSERARNALTPQRDHWSAMQKSEQERDYAKLVREFYELTAAERASLASRIQLGRAERAERVLSGLVRNVQERIDKVVRTPEQEAQIARESYDTRVAENGDRKALEVLSDLGVEVPMLEPGHELLLDSDSAKHLEFVAELTQTLRSERGNERELNERGIDELGMEEPGIGERYRAPEVREIDVPELGDDSRGLDC